MVEFGLKLEDNKVSKWNFHYLDYDHLKKLLKRVKLPDKILLEYKSKCPSLVSEVQERLIAQEIQKENELNNGTPKKRNEKNSPPSASFFTSDNYILSEAAPLKNTAVLDAVDRSDNLEGDDSDIQDYGSNTEIQEVLLTKSKKSSPMKLSISLSSLSSLKSYIYHPGAVDEITLERIEAYAVERREHIMVFDASVLEMIENRVERFFVQKVKEYKDRYEFLINSVEESSIKQDGYMDGSVVSPKLLDNNLDDTNTDSLRREIDSIKRDIIDLHRNSKLLSNFAVLNYTGFVKIIKKYEKKFPDRKNKLENAVKNREFTKEKNHAEALADQLEEIYAKWFCDGNVRSAHMQMLPKKGDGLQTDWSFFRLGYRLGCCSVLCFWVCWDCIWGSIAKGNSAIGSRDAFPVFRGVAGLLLFHWFWGISTYIWSRYRVNYIFLFEFDPRTVRTPTTIFNSAVDQTIVYFLSMLLYYKAEVGAIPNIMPPGGYSVLLVFYTIHQLVFPWNCRGPLWTAIKSTFQTPFVSPTFFTIYIGDVMTSMVKVFQDIAWTACFILSGDFLSDQDDAGKNWKNWQHQFWYSKVLIPLICLFPLMIRFLQCIRRYRDTKKRIPNLANAFKYSLSQTVTLFGTFHPLYMYHERHVKSTNLNEIDLFQIFWFGLFVLSSLYSFFWDVYMDWGLGRQKHAFLGPRLMFPNIYYYYVVIFADLFLRMSWLTTLLPPNSGAKFALPTYLHAVTMILELFRRMLWGFFRLENEHRHNTAGFRRVDFVPLHFSTGHNHKYKSSDEKPGTGVLVEISIVVIAVVGVCISSIISAQKLSKDDSV